MAFVFDFFLQILQILQLCFLSIYEKRWQLFPAEDFIILYVYRYNHIVLCNVYHVQFLLYYYMHVLINWMLKNKVLFSLECIQIISSLITLIQQCKFPFFKDCQKYTVIKMYASTVYFGDFFPYTDESAVISSTEKCFSMKLKMWRRDQRCRSFKYCKVHVTVRNWTVFYLWSVFT